MNKLLIWISILLSSVMIIVNFVSVIPLLFIYRVNNGTVVITSIILGVMLWVWLKGLLDERSNKSQYSDDDGFQY